MNDVTRTAPPYDMVTNATSDDRPPTACEVIVASLDARQFDLDSLRTLGKELNAVERRRAMLAEFLGQREQQRAQDSRRIEVVLRLMESVIVDISEGKAIDLAVRFVRSHKLLTRVGQPFTKEDDEICSELAEFWKVDVVVESEDGSPEAERSGPIPPDDAEVG